MSEQNPSAEMPPPAPTYGSAPAGPETVGQAPPPAPAEAAPKKGGFPRWILTLILVIVVAAAGYWFTRDDAVNANVGDCLAGTTPAALNADDLKVADCTNADAGFKVVQKVEDKLRGEADASCTDPAAEYVFWSGKEGKKGTVLCLATVTK